MAVGPSPGGALSAVTPREAGRSERLRQCRGGRFDLGLETTLLGWLQPPTCSGPCCGSLLLQPWVCAGHTWALAPSVAGGSGRAPAQPRGRAQRGSTGRYPSAFLGCACKPALSKRLKGEAQAWFSCQPRADVARFPRFLVCWQPKRVPSTCRSAAGSWAVPPSVPCPSIPRLPPAFVPGGSHHFKPGIRNISEFVFPFSQGLASLLLVACVSRCSSV